MLYKVLQILLGYDFGYIHQNKSPRLKWSIKCINLFQCVFASFVIMWPRSYSELVLWVWYFYYAFKHVVYAFIFTFLRSDHIFWEFERKFDKIGIRVGSHEATLWVKKLQMRTIFAILSYRVLRISIYCYASKFCTGEITDLILFNLVCVAFEVILFSISFQFCSAYYRFKLFGKHLKSALDDELEYYLRTFESLVNLTKEFKKAYQRFYLIIILFNIPDALFSIYRNLYEFRNNIIENPGTLQSHCLNQLCIAKIIMEVWSLLVTLVPAMAAGTLHAEIQNIRVILYDRRLAETNDSKRFELDRFIRFVEARPLKFAVYKVIPLDASLLGIVLNFCATYIIVLLQLNHVY